MNITLYASFNKRYNSTLRPSGGTVVTVVLKEETSLEKPSFLISNVNWNWNYCSWAGRYYYVTDIISEGNNLFRVDCVLDVLATYKNEIGSYTAYVARSASAYDPTVKDTLYPSKVDVSRQIVTHGNLAGMFTDSLYDGTYLLGAFGKGGSGMSIYAMPPTSFYGLVNAIFPATSDDWATYLSGSFSSALNGGVTNVLNYITFIRWIPIDWTTFHNAIPMTSGMVYLGGMSCGFSATYCRGTLTYDTGNLTFTVPQYYTNNRGDWQELEPYASYSLQAGPWGTIQMDGRQIVTDRLFYVRIRINVLSGIGTLILYNKDGGVIGQYETTLVFDVKAAGGGTNIIGVAGGLIQSAVSAAAGDVVGATAGIASSAAAAIPKAAQMGGNSSGISPMLTSNFALNCDYWTPADEDITEFGRPLMQYVQISTLSGYVQCYGASCPLTGREADRQAVNTFLNNGFFYE